MFGPMAWHMAAENGHIKLLENLWECAKELQLRPKESSYVLRLSKTLSMICPALGSSRWPR
jgi:hypothetical protein